jgi:hypothetical protein
MRADVGKQKKVIMKVDHETKRTLVAALINTSVLCLDLYSLFENLRTAPLKVSIKKKIKWINFDFAFSFL